LIWLRSMSETHFAQLDIAAWTDMHRARLGRKMVKNLCQANTNERYHLLLKHAHKQRTYHQKMKAKVDKSQCDQLLMNCGRVKTVHDVCRAVKG